LDTVHALLILLQVLRNRFVTGDWDAAAVRSAARPEGDDGLSDDQAGSEEEGGSGPFHALGL
jgi:hypothetical protein